MKFHTIVYVIMKLSDSIIDHMLQNWNVETSAYVAQSKDREFLHQLQEILETNEYDEFHHIQVKFFYHISNF